MRAEIKFPQLCCFFLLIFIIVSVSNLYGIKLSFRNFCGCRKCFSHTILLESLPANRNMFDLIFCILGSLIFSILLKKNIFLIVHALLSVLPSPQGEFCRSCFSLSISPNELFATYWLSGDWSVWVLQHVKYVSLHV